MGFLSELFFDKTEMGSKGQVAAKWIIRISLLLISGAFVFGQIKMQHLNRLEKIEEKTEKNIQLTYELKENLNHRFNETDRRVDAVYEDTYNALNNFSDEYQKQLELIIDFDGENKEILKNILNIRQDQLKTTSENILFSPNINEIRNITISEDTIIIRNATKFHLDSIKRNGFEVFEIEMSDLNNKINFKYKK